MWCSGLGREGQFRNKMPLRREMMTMTIMTMVTMMIMVMMMAMMMVMVMIIIIIMVVNMMDNPGDCNGDLRPLHFS